MKSEAKLGARKVINNLAGRQQDERPKHERRKAERRSLANSKLFRKGEGTNQVGGGSPRGSNSNSAAEPKWRGRSYTSLPAVAACLPR